jgi:hypothetical protein
MLLVLCLAGAGCQPASRSVALPAGQRADWIVSEPAGASAPQEQTPWPDLTEAFGEAPLAVASIRASVSASDFYGNRLFDGFDLVVQPLERNDHPIRKLGRLTVVLHKFDPETLSGLGPELMCWHVEPARMVQLWKKTGIDEAYHMKLAWASRPSVNRVRMSIRFETPDGGDFTELRSEDIDQPRYRWLLK